MVEQKNIVVRILHPLLVYAAYLFLYIPIVIIAMFSFNDSRLSVKWTGFSLRWYAKIFQNPEILHALNVSLIVAICSMLLSVAIGTWFVIASKRWKSWLSYGIVYPNIVLPDLAVGIGILSIFVMLHIPLGYGSLIIGHSVVGLGFVIPIVRARFQELDPFLTEASLDLGATYFQTLRKIVLPLLSPSLLAAALVVFTLSLDDFLIAFFCSNPKIQTLSIYVYSQLKETVDPSINAISVLLLTLSSLAALVLCALNVIDQVLGHE